MDSKSIFASKTLWANVIALVAMILTSRGIDLGLTPEVQAELVGGILVAVNIVLRVVTKQPVHVVAPKDDSSQSGDANAITPGPKGD